MSAFEYMEMWEIELEAMSRMCAVIVAQPHQLQFDIDDSSSEDRFWQWLQRARAIYPDIQVDEWKSRSGNTHRVVEPFVAPVEERIAMQAMGGSDPGREWAAWQCHKQGSPHPILLYRPLPKMLVQQPPPKLLTHGGSDSCSN